MSSDYKRSDSINDDSTCLIIEPTSLDSPGPNSALLSWPLTTSNGVHESSNMNGGESKTDFNVFISNFDEVIVWNVIRFWIVLFWFALICLFPSTLFWLFKLLQSSNSFFCVPIQSLLKAREAFARNITKSVTFRVEQLKNLRRCIDENYEDFVGALKADFNKVIECILLMYSTGYKLTVIDLLVIISLVWKR